MDLISDKDYFEKHSGTILKKQNSINREIKYARMINKSDYKINWSNDAVDISDLVFAFLANAIILTICY